MPAPPKQEFNDLRSLVSKRVISVSRNQKVLGREPELAGDNWWLNELLANPEIILVKMPPNALRRQVKRKKKTRRIPKFNA